MTNSSPGEAIRRVVFGTANIGQPYGRRRHRGIMPEEEAFALLDAAWALGIRAFDTASGYGQAIPRLKRWLETRGVCSQAHVVAKAKPADPETAAEQLRLMLRAFDGCASLAVFSHDKVNGPPWRTVLEIAQSAGASTGQSVYTGRDVLDVLKLPGVSYLQVPGNVYYLEAIEARGNNRVQLDVRSIFLQGLLLDAPEVAEARVPGAGRLALAVREAARLVGEPPATMLVAAMVAVLHPADRLVIGADEPLELEAVARGLVVDSTTGMRFLQRAREGLVLPLDSSITDPRCWSSNGGRKLPRGKVVAIIQARCSSTRLPGKVLSPIGGVTLIERVIDQIRGAHSVDQVVVATSSDPSDDPLVALLAARRVPCYRGDLNDVLGRLDTVADATNADVIVRLTGDCPLQTPDTVDEVVTAFLDAGVDYATNTEPYTRPDGQDVEVFTRAALALAARSAVPGPDREHVTPYLRRASGIQRLLYVHRDELRGAALRWTVDVPADLAQVRKIWERLDELAPGPHTYERVMKIAAEVGAQPNAEIPNRGYYKSLYSSATGQKASPLPLRRSNDVMERSARVIPGGAQTYSKSWRQHIRGVSPIFLERGQGARVWDADGNEYVDLIQGLLPNILGYAHPEVDRAVYEQARRGHSFSLPHPLEVELAERLVRLIPCAEMVRFGKNGSDATAGAVRVARAFTGRERVAVCGYHGWQDWYIGSTSRSAGVPKTVCQLAHPFPYNDLETLDRLLGAHKGEFAAVILEPYTFYQPGGGYLEGVKRVTHDHGAVLIFDEICTGFHLGLGGAQKMFGVIPDLATFGKAMGNGYPISCVVGRRDIMKMFDDVFVSFTFAGDVAAIAAALVVLDILEHTDAFSRMEAAGSQLRDGAVALAEEADLGKRFQTLGHQNWCLLRFLDARGEDDAPLRSLWVQEVTRRGVLILSTHNICAALDRSAVDVVLSAYAEAFKRAGMLLQDGASLTDQLDGPVPTPAFRVRG